MSSSSFILLCNSSAIACVYFQLSSLAISLSSPCTLLDASLRFFVAAFRLSFSLFFSAVKGSLAFFSSSASLFLFSICIAFSFSKLARLLALSLPLFLRSFMMLLLSSRILLAIDSLSFAFLVLRSINFSSISLIEALMSLSILASFVTCPLYPDLLALSLAIFSSPLFRDISITDSSIPSKVTSTALDISLTLLFTQSIIAPSIHFVWRLL